MVWPTLARALARIHTTKAQDPGSVNSALYSCKHATVPMRPMAAACRCHFQHLLLSLLHCIYQRLSLCRSFLLFSGLCSCPSSFLILRHSSANPANHGVFRHRAIAIAISSRRRTVRTPQTCTLCLISWSTGQIQALGPRCFQRAGLCFTMLPYLTVHRPFAIRVPQRRQSRMHHSIEPSIALPYTQSLA